MATGQQIVDSARAWVGTKWKHQGRTADGLDCVGLLIVVARDLKIAHYDATNYGHSPTWDVLRGHLLNHCYQVQVSRRQPGDILVMAFEGDPQHTAILTERGTVIHAVAKWRKVVEHQLDDEWRRRIRLAYRIKEVEG